MLPSGRWAKRVETVLQRCVIDRSLCRTEHTPYVATPGLCRLAPLHLVKARPRVEPHVDVQFTQNHMVWVVWWAPVHLDSIIGYFDDPRIGQSCSYKDLSFDGPSSRILNSRANPGFPMSDNEGDTSSSASSEWPVTEEWLENVLRRHHDDIPNPRISIVEFTVRPGCDTGESVLSDILAVNVEYRLIPHHDQDTHYLSFIIKLLPQDPFSRFFVTEAQFDLREIKFYTQVSISLIFFLMRITMFHTRKYVCLRK